MSSRGGKTHGLPFNALLGKGREGKGREGKAVVDLDGVEYAGVLDNNMMARWVIRGLYLCVVWNVLFVPYYQEGKI